MSQSRFYPCVPSSLRSGLWLALFVTTTAASCSADAAADSPIGLFEVTSHELREGDCDAPGEAVETGFSLFRVDEEELVGLALLAVFPCTDADSCADDRDSKWGLIAPPDGPPVDQYSASGGGSSECELSHNTREASLDGDVLVLEARRVAVIVSAEAEDCTSDAAKEARGEMTCASLETLTAERLE